MQISQDEIFPLECAQMSHITFSCILSVKIDFSLDSDSDSKYHEDQEKKGLHFFIGRKNVQNGKIQDGRQRI